MVIPVAFSCTPTFQELLTSSLEEDDLHFSYVPEKSTQIKLISPNDDKYCILLHINYVELLTPDCDVCDVYDACDVYDIWDVYDAGTEDNPAPIKPMYKPVRRKYHCTKRHTGSKDKNVSIDSEVGMEKKCYISIDTNVTTCGMDTSSFSANDETITESVTSGSMTSIQDNDVFNISLLSKLDFSQEMVQKLQHNDLELRPLIKYLSDGHLPTSQKRSQTHILQSADYAIIHGLLFHLYLKKSKQV